jgi:hypothetical protein
MQFGGGVQNRSQGEVVVEELGRTIGRKSAGFAQKK